MRPQHNPWMTKNPENLPAGSKNLLTRKEHHVPLIPCIHSKVISVVKYYNVVTVKGFNTDSGCYQLDCLGKIFYTYMYMVWVEYPGMIQIVFQLAPNFFDGENK